MNYIGVGELKQSKRVWRALAKDKELIVTRDGRPAALMVEITPERAEESLRAVRRALFSSAVSSARLRAQEAPPADGEIEREITAARRARD